MSKQIHLNLGKREINLLFLIGSAILLPAIGGDIRSTFDNQQWLPFIVTIMLTSALFYIIVKSTKIVFPSNKKEKMGNHSK